MDMTEILKKEGITDRNLSAEVREFVKKQTGFFTLKGCYETLGISGKDKDTVRKAISRMMKEKNPKFQKTERVGVYEVINRSSNKTKGERKTMTREQELILIKAVQMLIDYIAIEKRVDLMNARREGSRALYSEIDEELEDLEKISDELEKLKMN